MDIRLPGVSGLVLTQKIKAAYPDIIICILTNYDTPECREAAFRYGADCFIAKESFNRMRLEGLVRSYYKIWDQGGLEQDLSINGDMDEESPD